MQGRKGEGGRDVESCSGTERDSIILRYLREVASKSVDLQEQQSESAQHARDDRRPLRASPRPRRSPFSHTRSISPQEHPATRLHQTSTLRKSYSATTMAEVSSKQRAPPQPNTIR